jgi:hypothetical protein
VVLVDDSSYAGTVNERENATVAEPTRRTDTPEMGRITTGTGPGASSTQPKLMNEWVLDNLAKDLEQLPDALVIPLGPAWGKRSS